MSAFAKTDPHRYELVDEERRFEASDPEHFDRVAFALRALDILNPANMTVAVYERSGGFFVERVRDLRHGPRAMWAMLGIPPRASRAQIALTLLELAGVGHEPFLVDLLVAGL